jgi:hypothetical protein
MAVFDVDTEIAVRPDFYAVHPQRVLEEITFFKKPVSTTYSTNNMALL